MIESTNFFLNIAYPTKWGSRPYTASVPEVTNRHFRMNLRRAIGFFNGTGR